MYFQLDPVASRHAAKKVSDVWSHRMISTRDSKVRTTLIVSITNSGSERVNTSFVKKDGEKDL